MPGPICCTYMFLLCISDHSYAMYKPSKVHIPGPKKCLLFWPTISMSENRRHFFWFSQHMWPWSFPPSFKTALVLGSVLRSMIFNLVLGLERDVLQLARQPFYFYKYLYHAAVRVRVLKSRDCKDLGLRARA